jgi:hypothetical protein
MPISEFLKKNSISTIVLLLASGKKYAEINNCKDNFVTRASDFNEENTPIGKIEHEDEDFIIFLKE